MSETAKTDSAIVFDEGLIGFPQAQRFELLQAESDGSLLLRCVDNPKLQLPVVDPLQFDPNYRPTIRPSVMQRLAGSESGSLLLLAIAVKQAGGPLLANLRAPLLIDPERRKGVQIILEDARYPLAAPAAELAAAR